MEVVSIVGEIHPYVRGKKYTPEVPNNNSALLKVVQNLEMQITVQKGSVELFPFFWPKSQHFDSHPNKCML